MTLLEAVEYVNLHGNDYAKSYARVALMNWNNTNEEEFKAQILYIRCNISGMRGEKAREARKVLKAFSEEGAKAPLLG